MKKIIAPTVILALEKALSLIYWYKGDLKRYLNVYIQPEILSVIDWSDTKKNIVARVVNMLVKNESKTQDVLLVLIRDVSNITNFTHLEMLEDGNRKAKDARDSVEDLKKITNAYFKNKEEDDSYKERALKAMEENNKTNRKKQFLYSLKESFLRNMTQQNNQKRGYYFEKFLYDLFNLFDMDAKSSFKIIGEQIDGAFTFENDEYLLEAKWQDKPSGVEDLFAFRGKVEGKLDNTLGFFVSMAGFSKDAIVDFLQGKKVVMLMDSYDIMAVLDERISLDDLLKRKKKEAAHSGNIYLNANDILNK